MKKILKITALFVPCTIVLILIYVGITFPPVMAGMAAKTVCSCVHVSGRSVESIKEKELLVFPGLSSATVELNNTDSSVTAKILWRTSKAIFRKGLGCTLLASMD
ncbi:MAG: hypothetical protein C0490_06440, partial [Marivirga sp.]|nr:hypothetical protein [Marivirga sp.]